MTLDLVLAYFHFVSILGTVALLVAEHVACRPGIVAEDAKRLRNLDLGYFVFAMAALTSGLSRAIWGAKGWETYAFNPVFQAKLGVFLLVGLLSVPPTLRYFAWVRLAGSTPGAPIEATEVKRVQLFLRAELVLILALPLLGAMLARGLSFG